MNRTDALDKLRNEVTAAIEGKRDYLEAITVAQPDGVGAEVWRREVEAMLFDMHLDGIDVKVNGPAQGGAWLQKTHLSPSWT